jgi:hypothetical protein
VSSVVMPFGPSAGTIRSFTVEFSPVPLASLLASLPFALVMHVHSRTASSGMCASVVSVPARMRWMPSKQTEGGGGGQSSEESQKGEGDILLSNDQSSKHSQSAQNTPL